MFIIKSKLDSKFILNFKILDIYTGEFQSGDRNVGDDEISPFVLLGMIDIGTSQMGSFADSFAKFNDCRIDIFTAASDLKSEFMIFE
jgi:chemotaxis protein CheY-P-specific phosphatase CheC